MNDRRIGRFSISVPLIEKNPEIVRAIMGKCIIVKADMLYLDGLIEYFAISPDFDLVQEGMGAPEYTILINGKTGKDIVFTKP